MLSFFTIMMNVAIIWTNTNIIIPLGDSLESYKSMPVAQLTINGVNVQDLSMYYEYEVNHTSFGVVRTNVVGTYTVWYRVVFPKYNFETEEAITFTVKDQIKPTIVIDKEIQLDVGTKIPDFSQYVTYSDNYDELNELKLTITSTGVNMNVIGIYEVRYQVDDTSSNTTILVQKVKIVDRTRPVIKQKLQIAINVNQTIEIDKYFSFEDNYDKVLKVEIDDQQINYLKPGIYDLYVKVTDQSGNMTTSKTTVTIIDNESPVIKLKITSLTINYQDIITLETLKSYIQSVSDNLDDLKIDDVLISSYIESNYIGTYTVLYEITDSNHQKTSETLTVSVKDTQSPKITLDKEVVVKVFDLEPYIYDYLRISDNYNATHELLMSKSGSVDTSKIGFYRVIVTVKDVSKNETIFPVLVEVKDDIAPSLKVPSKIEVNDFKKPNYDTLFEVSDNYDKAVNLVIYDQLVDYQTIGSYEIIVSAFDQSMNETRKTFELKIIDDSLPEVILSTNQVHISFGTQTIDYLKYVDSIYDAYDKSLTKDDINVISELDFNKIGLYKVIYQISDQFGNQSETTLLLYLDDYEAPVITVFDMTLNKGERFNYLNYASAYDNYDQDISHQININPNFIPTTITGHYEVTFYIHDSSGNYSEKKVILTIIENDTWIDYLVYGSGLLVVFGGLVIFYMMKKKREKF